MPALSGPAWIFRYQVQGDLTERSTMKLVSTTLAMIVGLVACSEPSAPRYSTRDFAIEPVSSRLQVGVADADVVDRPAVKVYRTLDGSGLAGREVEFTVETPSRVKTIVKVTTSASGIATLPAWRIGSQPGVYVANASADGSDPIVFRAVIPGAIVEIFDLETTIPANVITEAHYALYEGGVYNAFYGSPLQPFSIAEDVFGMYARSPSRIDFLREITGLASLPRVVSAGFGTLNGREMTVLRGNPLDDFPMEIFGRR